MSRKRIIYVPIESLSEMNELSMVGFVGQFSKCKELTVCRLERNLNGMEESLHINELHQNKQNKERFPDSIEEAIANRRAVATVDASIKENYMAASLIITSLDNAEQVEGKISSSRQEQGMIPTAEGLGVYNLIKYINKLTKHKNTGKIMVYFENKKVFNGCNSKIMKESQYVQEASATIEGIKDEVQKAIITISLEYSSDKPRPNRTFQQQPDHILVKECDVRSKEIRVQLSEEDKDDIPHVAPTTLVHEGVIKDKAIAILIREINA